MYNAAPYVAAAILMIINVVASFIGHKKFSFASDADTSPVIRLQEKK
jgi:hypothetical protein